MIELPPGAMVELTKDGSKASVPLWLYWLQIAESHAEMAEKARPSDAYLDYLSAQLAHLDVPKVEPGEGENGVRETTAAMVAITAAAHALDGFYGAVKRSVQAPGSKAKRPKRHRQILETVKLGFRVGSFALQWLDELDWLFETRDLIVHHAEELRPLVVIRVTEQTVVAGGPEGFAVGADSARRAATLARKVISECLGHPRANTDHWATPDPLPSPLASEERP